MRDIRFRQPLIRKGKFDSWHYWGFLSDGNFSSPSNDWVSQNKEYPSQQFTGLKDKNGKEIYEGDVCKMHKGEIGTVRYSDGYYDIDRPHKTDGQWIDWPTEYFEDCEIIGNIYSNPELLNAKESTEKESIR